VESFHKIDIIENKIFDRINRIDRIQGSGKNPVHPVNPVKKNRQEEDRKLFPTMFNLYRNRESCNVYRVSARTAGKRLPLLDNISDLRVLLFIRHALSYVTSNEPEACIFCEFP
jgi:hypothetical protein